MSSSIRCRVSIAALAVLCVVTALARAEPDKATFNMFRDCKTCPELVRITPGSFVMGSAETETTAARMRADRAAAERPALPVTIAYPFAIGRREVTIAEFGEFAKATAFKAAGCWALNGKSWKLDSAATWDKPGTAATPRHPAVCLSPDDFQPYLDWLSKRTGQRYRFPSEAEWEYVVRSGMREVKVWTDVDAKACGQFNAADAQFHKAFAKDWPGFSCDDGYAVTAPTGRYAANTLGMFDTLGNAAEFVADCYAPSHAGAPTDGRPRLEAKPCKARVAKGGSWAAEPGFLRPATRVLVTSDVRGSGFGMRVLRELPQGSAARAANISSR